MFKSIGKIIKWIGEHFKGMLFLLIVVFLFMPNSSKMTDNANLQEIELTGPIMNADKVLEQIESAQKNKNIKGVLLNVNSPGGSVPPSIEISYAIRELQKHKPVIAYASGIMASGSYYSSIYASKIIANPGAIVGSIGVIMQSADLSEIMNTLGVKTQIVKQGKFKEAGTKTRQWTKDEREELETLTKDAYELFIKDVADARGLDVNNAKKYADAHIFSAKRAKEAGLIDQIAVKSEVKKILIKDANVTKAVWKEKDKVDSFIEKIKGESLIKVQNYFYGLQATL
ncbi:protease IV (PspA) [hydrothermal vent metagenome]|uniref:Protease IV (PspA) n=1 Tax=hydrothermal vent metagenome TaxID=652676 RepID=A0A1W1EDL4_9ZZZZ